MLMAMRLEHGRFGRDRFRPPPALVDLIDRHRERPHPGGYPCCGSTAYQLWAFVPYGCRTAGLEDDNLPVRTVVELRDQPCKPPSGAVSLSSGNPGQTTAGVRSAAHRATRVPKHAGGCRDHFRSEGAGKTVYEKKHIGTVLKSGLPYP